MYLVLVFLLPIFLLSAGWGDELTVDPPTSWEVIKPPCPAPPLCPSPDDERVVVDLIDPLYQDGVLSTESGGVLTAPDIRIQAQHIIYTRNLEREEPMCTVSCEGNLLVDYQQWALVGDSLYYDFANHQGSLINGRTAEPPWYIGGREISLLETGEMIVLDGFITTSEGEIEDVVLRASRICLSPNRILSARNVSIEVNGVPIFWLPTLQLDLNAIRRPPFAVRYGWRGFTGSYVSLLYRFLNWRELEATARLDAFFGKGIGVGIETAYDPEDRPTVFYTRNYFANDFPIDTPKRKSRYRFQGTYVDCFGDLSVDGVYDAVSDGHMAADYQTRDFDLKTAGRTRVELRKQTPSWIARLLTCVRVNHFQSVPQELPTLQLHLHPFEILGTGMIWENEFRVSYLSYVFSDEITDKPDNFSSGRLAVCPRLYRPCLLGPVLATPEIGFIGIAYSNSPGGRSAGQALGQCGVNIETALSRSFNQWKHVIEPYLHYHFLTSPRVKTDHHFIFTIEDGLDHLNQLRFGVRNSLFHTSPFIRSLWIDLWANAFFATSTLKTVIPRGYWNIEWQLHPRMIYTFLGGWNFQHQQLDFYNVRLDWTVSEHLAYGVEFRHRGRFYWRKADFYNFILDSVRTERKLLDSTLSDPRNTLLFRIFARLNPDWTLELDLRTGRHKRNPDVTAELDPRTGRHKKQKKSYLEYNIELTRVIYQHWRMIFNYEKREVDHRVSFAILLNPGPP